MYKYNQKSVKLLVKCKIKYVGNSFTTYTIFRIFFRIEIFLLQYGTQNVVMPLYVITAQLPLNIPVLTREYFTLIELSATLYFDHTLNLWISYNFQDKNW
jgi:hypothetical protein